MTGEMFSSYSPRAARASERVLSNLKREVASNLTRIWRRRLPLTLVSYFRTFVLSKVRKYFRTVRRYEGTFVLSYKTIVLSSWNRRETQNKRVLSRAFTTTPDTNWT